MKKIVLILISLFIFENSFSQNWMWDTLVSSDGVINLIKDNNNHVYTYTKHRSNVAKYDYEGQLLWQKYFPGIELQSVICFEDHIYFIANFCCSITFEGTLISGSGDDDILIAKYNSNGTFIWVKMIASSGKDSGGDICIEKNSNLLITGCSSGPTDYSGTLIPKSTNRDLFIARYDLSGNFLNSFFSNFMGCSDIDCGSTGLEIETDHNNDIILLAGVHGKVQIDTAIIENYYSGWFIKMDSSFNMKWISSVESHGYACYSSNMMVNSENEILYTLNQYWNAAWYGKLKKLSNDGTVFTTLLSENFGHINGIDLDTFDNVYFAGEYFNYSFDGTPPTQSFLHYGRINAADSLDWLYVDSAYSKRSGYDIAVQD
nr:hypothetical protein [Bacteroidota bacterium]